MVKYKAKRNLTFVLGSAAPILLIIFVSCLGPVSSNGGDLVLEHEALSSHNGQSHAMSAPQIDINRCRENISYIWCLPHDYNQEKHPYTSFELVNKSLPWDYDFRFVIGEISNINDKAQTMSISMYFGVSWMEPRLQINESATEWTEDRTGPKNQVNESPESLKYIWYPELEIYGLELFGRQRVLKEMSGVRIRKNKTINYELGVRVKISCQMNFDDYPLDAHTCQFQVGSYYDTNLTVTCKSHFMYTGKRQRSLQYDITIEQLPDKYQIVKLHSGHYAACGFQIRLERKQMQYIVQVYLPSVMFVIVSWVSFLIKPEVVPGRMALLVTLFLVLINIFNSVREQAPISSRLNAIDLYLVVCIFLVFGALMEYAVILLLLKKRRKPRRMHTIDAGLRGLFNQNINGEPSHSIESSHDKEAATSPKRMIDSEDEAETKLDLIGTSNRCASPIPNSPSHTQTHKTKALDPNPDPRKQAMCDNIDAWAMWLFLPAFIAFNIIYWLAYRHGSIEDETIE